MPVPFNDLRRRFAPLRQQFLDAMDSVLDSGVLIGGGAVQDFEKKFADSCGAGFCVGVANGTDALEIALKACGVGEGDEVITVANAGGYATTAIFACAARPVYVDVEVNQLQMDLALVPSAVTTRTRAIVQTHLFGVMNDIFALRECLKKLGRSDIAIVEDCAQAHGAELKGRAGSLGDAAAFSFYPTKNLGGLGDSGAVVTQSCDIAAKARKLYQYGWSSKYQIALSGGRNSRMDPVQAAFLSIQLPGLDSFNERRREICKYYSNELHDDFRLVQKTDRSFVGHLAVIIAPTSSARDKLRTCLNDAQIGCDVHYPVLDFDQLGWPNLRRPTDEMPISRTMTDRILSVPCFPELTHDEIEEVGNVIRSQ